MSKIDAEVTIVGGGLVGLALGIALAQEKIPVAVIDKGAPERELKPDFDGRASAISWAPHNLFQRIGVWKHIGDHAEPIRHIHVTDDDSTAVVHYDCEELQAGNPFGFIIENRRIRYALHQRAQELPTLKWLAPKELAAAVCGEKKTTVTLTDGTVIEAPLLVSAEGRRASLRDQFGIKSRMVNYGQTAIVCTIKHEKPHHGIAWEKFLSIGPFAVLPMTGQRCGIVWSESTENAPNYLALPDAEFCKHLALRLGDGLGKFELAGPRFSYPLSLNLAREFTAHRFALAGDSAHGVHPIAGQGVNLGYRDVAVLAELIADAAKAGKDVGGDELLQHYQRWRRFDSLSSAGVMDGLNRLFSNDIGIVKFARRTGMRMVNRIKPLKQFLARDAMGMTGDLPRLLKDVA